MTGEHLLYKKRSVQVVAVIILLVSFPLVLWWLSWKQGRVIARSERNGRIVVVKKFLPRNALYYWQKAILYDDHMPYSYQVSIWLTDYAVPISLYTCTRSTVEDDHNFASVQWFSDDSFVVKLSGSENAPHPVYCHFREAEYTMDAYTRFHTFWSEEPIPVGKLIK